MQKVLVVDDDEALRELYRHALEGEGYEVILAEDGREAIEMFKKTDPDLIVLDIRMPNMDGMETLAQVMCQFKRVPVILNTAYASYKHDFRSWGADAYLVKSSDLTELKAKVRELLEAKDK